MDLRYTTLEVDTTYKPKVSDEDMDFEFALNLWLKLAKGIEEEVFINRGYSYYNTVIRWSLVRQTTVFGGTPFEVSVSLWNSYTHKKQLFVRGIKFRKNGLYYDGELISAKKLAERLCK